MPFFNSKNFFPKSYDFPLELQGKIVKKYDLIFPVDLDDNDTDVLVVGVIGHLGDVPVAGEEDEKLVGSAVVEPSAALLVVVVNHVGAVLAVGCAGVVVDDPETLHAPHHVLEVDVVVVALGHPLLQRLVAAVLHAHHERGAGDAVLAAGDAQHVGLGEILEECLPLTRVLLVLKVEVYEVYARVGTRLVESVAPHTRRSPFLCLHHQVGAVAVVLCVVALAKGLAARCLALVASGGLLCVCRCRGAQQKCDAKDNLSHVCGVATFTSAQESCSRDARDDHPRRRLRRIRP